MTISKLKTGNTESSTLKQSTISFNQEKSSVRNLPKSFTDSNIIKQSTKNSDVSYNEKVKVDLDSSFSKLPALKQNNFAKPNKVVSVNSPRSQSCRPKSKKLQKSKEISQSNHNLLDLWSAVRRSERGADKIEKEKKDRRVIENIINRKEEGMRIINTIDKGRGIESTVPFSKDSFIVEYAGDLISEKAAIERELEYQKDPNKGSYMFHFKYNEIKYCVDATAESGRVGRLLNHSKLNPNCYVKIIPIDKVPRLTIFAKTDIEIGEELVYDYGDRDKATIDANPWLKY